MHDLPLTSIIGILGRVSSHATWELTGMSETPDSTTIPVLVLREKAIGSNMPPVAVGVRVSGEINSRCFGIMNAKIRKRNEICKF